MQGAEVTIRTLLSTFWLLAGLVLALAPGQPMAADRIVIGQAFLAAGLDPAQGSNAWSLVSHGVAEQLFTVSREGRVVPNLAASAARNGDGSWTVELAPGRRFSDGAPVTAEAVAAALNRTGEMNPSARASAGRLRFIPVDEGTLRVESEEPTSILPSILAEWAFAVYRMSGESFLFTGPFAVARMDSGGSIELSPNPWHEGADERPAITLRRIADGQSLALAFASGELDMAFNLPVEALPMLEGMEGRVVSFPVAYQYMMWMNTRSPPLADPRVRRAIDLSIDREELVTAVRAGTPATGAFASIFPFAAREPLPFDPARAAALLDEAGWLSGEDGVRRRDGERLELVLHAYVQRPDLVTLQPVIRAALARIGIAVTTRITESPTEVAASGAFDLFLWAQHTAPAGDPGLFLSLFFETGAARNYTGWSNPAYDAVAERLRAEAEPEARIALALEAQGIIREEAPVAFLMTPSWHVGLSPALADYEPWGSDYYIVRPDLRVAR